MQLTLKLFALPTSLVINSLSYKLKSDLVRTQSWVVLVIDLVLLSSVSIHSDTGSLFKQRYSFKNYGKVVLYCSLSLVNDS